MKTRAMGALADIAFGRPYGKFRDYVFGKTHTTASSSFIRKATVDTAALIAFWMPIYVGMMEVAGVPKRNMLIAALVSVPASVLEGRPFGIYMDWVRSKCGLRPAADGVEDNAK